MQLIITRPPAQAASWVQELAALGCDARALPLIDIAPAADPAPVVAAWHTLRGLALVMFVSANAVQHFFALRPLDVPWPQRLRAGSTGPGTTAALRTAGVPDACIVEPSAEAGTFDSEALWARLAAEDWRGLRVLIVRGEDGRDWLATTLRERGARVDFAAAYRRQPPQPDTAGLALLAQALADPAAHLWVFSSSEAVANLRGLAPQADWSRSRAVASHPRIAAAVKAAGFAEAALVAPTAAALVQAFNVRAGEGAGPPGAGAPAEAPAGAPSIQSKA